MFSSVETTRLSTQITRWPRSRSASQRWEPRNPAPPVTSDVGIGRMVVGGISWPRIMYAAGLRNPLARRGKASAEVLVRLHVEPHREERHLQAGDEKHGDEDDRGRRDRVPRDPQGELHEPENE